MAPCGAIGIYGVRDYQPPKAASISYFMCIGAVENGYPISGSRE
jgi:hypothetical protein